MLRDPLSIRSLRTVIARPPLVAAVKHSASGTPASPDDPDVPWPGDHRQRCFSLARLPLEERFGVSLTRVPPRGGTLVHYNFLHPKAEICSFVTERAGPTGRTCSRSSSEGTNQGWCPWPRPGT